MNSSRSSSATSGDGTVKWSWNVRLYPVTSANHRDTPSASVVFPTCSQPVMMSFIVPSSEYLRYRVQVSHRTDNSSVLGVSPCLTNLSMRDYLGVNKSQQSFKPTCGMGKAVTNASI